MNKMGHSSRLIYDDCYYPDSLSESIEPGNYKLQEYQISNCNACLSTLGPRSDRYGFGVSTTAPFKNAAHSQDLTDDESFLSGRTLRASKCRNGKVSIIDMNELKLNDAKICDRQLVSEHTHLTHPAKNYRDVPINRFYNLFRDPQANIFYDFAVNTTLEAKDNFIPVGPKILPQKAVLPKEENCDKSPYTLGCLSVLNREL